MAWTLRTSWWVTLGMWLRLMSVKLAGAKRGFMATRRGSKVIYGGCVDRGTGVLILEAYDKVKVGEIWERRFGPPRADELTTLCSSS